MVRLLGEPQSPRVFWLALFLAVLLLVGVSSPAARAAPNAALPEVARDVDALLALGEALRDKGAGLSGAPVHPAIADGGEVWLKSLSVRRARTLQRKLAILTAHAGQDNQFLQTLAIETNRLLLELTAFGHQDSDRAGLERTLERLAKAQPNAAAAALVEPAAVPLERETLPRVLRGRSL